MYSMELNLTHIVFDDKLKQLFRNTHTDKSDILEGFHINNLDMVGLSLDQQTLLEWFQLNIQHINFSRNTKTLSKPDYFALFCGLVVDFEGINSWVDVLEQFDNVTFVSTKVGGCVVVDTSGSEIPSNTMNCCCGKCIKNTYTLSCEKTQRKLVIGSQCITKVSIVNPVVDKKLNLEMKKQKEIQSNRQCIDCKNFVIDKKKPEYVKRCMGCYIAYQKQQSDNARHCGDCGKCNIPVSSPAYIKLCKKCYYTKKHF